MIIFVRNKIGMMRIVLLLFTLLTFGQQKSNVDFIKVNAHLKPNPVEKSIYGKIEYVFCVKNTLDTVSLDAQNMVFTDFKINGNSFPFVNTGKKLKFIQGLKKGKNKLEFSYTATPKQTLYFNGDFKCISKDCVENNQIWTQGQGKYTSHWFPSFDDVNEKLVFNLSVTFDKRYQVLSNGFLKKVTENKETKTWNYSMSKPMSSYLLAMVIGDFSNKVISSKSRIPLQFFIKTSDTSKFESTYKYSKEIFDYLEQEIGVKYPWKLYKQVPVSDFLYAGMENTTLTIFDQNYVVDEIEFNDRNYVNVNAHELAHQWFGNLVTAKSGKHHWLQEGFATYYALLAERKIFGDDYFYHKLYRTSIQLKNASKTDTIPLLNDKASTLSFYQKGAWALHFIRESIGDQLFQKAVKNYLKKFNYLNVETSDFINEIKKVAPNFDTIDFENKWLKDYRFQNEIALQLLKRNDFIKQLFEVQQLRNKPFEQNKFRYNQIMNSGAYHPVIAEILYQIKNVPFEDKKELIQKAMLSGDVKVRQALAEFIGDFPESFVAEYETLLKDKSYDTREIALLTLWKKFPEKRNYYLEISKDWNGTNDLSLRITHLTLALSNVSSEEEFIKYYSELLDYTSPDFQSATRMNAFTSLLNLDTVNKKLANNLVNATTHHKWQMTKYARDTIRTLLKKDATRAIFEELLPELNVAERLNLEKLLKE